MRRAANAAQPGLHGGWDPHGNRRHGRAIAMFVCFNGLRLVMAGAALGWLGAFAAHRAIASQLYGVGFSDPITWLAAGCGILLAAVLATLLPALRAARVDPSQALK